MTIRDQVNLLGKAQEQRGPAAIAEAALWKLDLVKQAVRGLAHRGQTGDIADAEDEALPVENVIDELKAEVEQFIPALLKAAAA